MSKFIRTKEGIEELIYNSEFEYYVTMHTETIISKDHIGMYQTADTIEELCDEFVFSSDVSSYVIDKKHIEHVKTTILKIYEDNKDTDYVKAMHPKFYGAIWIDKGLIYVAKLNDKGELVLI